jgi:hypothetical protein
MKQVGYESSMRRLLDGLTFQESRDWERFFIQAIGREDLQTGPLCNLTDGGAGIRHVSAATRQRMSASRKAVMDQPEMKQLYSRAIKAGLARPEVRKQMSESAKTAQMRPDVKHRMSAAKKAASARPEVKQRRSESRKIVCARPEVKQKMAEGRKHITRGKRYQRPTKGHQFKGIYPQGKKWIAKIDKERLGTFLTPEEAAQAYNDGVDKYWGGEGYKNMIPVAEKQ